MKEKFIVSLLANLGSNVFSLIASYLLILNIEISLMGVWFFLNTVINIGFFFVDLGFDNIHYQYSGRENSNTYFGTFFTIKIVLIVLNVFFTLILSVILQLWNSNLFIFLIILLFSKIFFSVATIFVINLRSKIKFIKAEMTIFTIIILKSLAIIYLALNITSISNPILFLCFSNFFFDLFYIIMILYLSKQEFKINKPKKSLILSYVRDAKPLIIFSMLLIVSTNVGNLILKYSFGSEVLGYFGIINTYIIPILLLISGSIINVYMALFSKYFEKKDISAVREMTYIIEKYSSIVFLLIILIVFLNGKLFFLIFLPSYLDSVPILYIMIFTPYLMGITRPYSYQLISGKNQASNSWVNSIVHILIIVLMFLLIPDNFLFFKTFGFGAIGYAIAQTIPWILWAVLNRHYTKKFYGIKYQKRILLHIPLGIIAYIVTTIIKNILIKIFFINGLTLFFISIFILIGVYLILLIIFKELKKADLLLFLQLLKIRNYFESLKQEFRNH